MTQRLVTAFLPPIILALILSLLLVLPGRRELQESAISPDLPLDFDFPGWYGIRQQESEQERTMLAGDTRFSKAVYTKLRESIFDRQLPPVHVSIVYSGSDMNASIHRPERCLPSQGHLELHSATTEVLLSDGRTVTFTKLKSKVPLKDSPGQYIHHLNYYMFIGHHRICAEHLRRTLFDIWDRTVGGCAQRWAYYQLGTCWGGGIGVTEDEADSLLRRVIADLTPGLVDWAAVGK